MKTFVYLFKKKGFAIIHCHQIVEDSMGAAVNFFYRHHSPDEWELVQITLIS